MKVPIYDIFSGAEDEKAVWLEAVEGLGAACTRVREFALDTPGHYFVFCPQTHRILFSIDTSIAQKNQKSESAS
jgi:hypothetical protein